MFDCSYTPDITIEWLRSMNNDETYMSYYLGLPIGKGRFRSPFRKDSHPTCSFHKGKNGILYFKDWSGDFNGDFVDVVERRFGINYHEALHQIAFDFGFISGNGNRKIVIPKVVKPFKKSDGADIRVSVKPFNKREREWWMKYCIDTDILKKFNVFPIQDIWLNGSKFFSNRNMLVFGYYGGKKDNLEMWRIYFPNRKPMRFLTNWPATMIQGYRQLRKKGDVVVITKSMKDVMCMDSFKIDAIAPNSENLFVSDEVLANLKKRFRKIIVLYDNDIPGIHGMREIKKKHPELEYLFIQRRYKAKDFSDFVSLYGKEKVEKTINYYKAKCLKI